MSETVAAEGSTDDMGVDQTEYWARLGPVGEYVDRRASALQMGYMADKSSSVASLAKLRRAVGTSPGDDPQTWAEVFGGLDDFGQRSDEATAEEWAAHIALTLFALHQQSQTTARMHRRGWPLGRSVRRLADAKGGPDDEGSKAIRRRFQVLGTSSSISEAAHHARGLITQMRGEGIALDYGLLADELVKLQDRNEAPRVRLAWGRAYYRTAARSGSGAAEKTPDESTQGEPS